ncbi:thioredoxin family protein [Nocardiopsis suaedae]|uniref:Thioredoxin family protein n=1 Tax=Nocardiopsis suaedae TaxID=3018444 RepID=A0ABT4TFB5_9ACTN|nr:thioredoxin family protein [Nocardiopsis suaedae]MDA2803388.1 thioredoxin family protein [Nocardiopsis suaedae]
MRITVLAVPECPHAGLALAQVDAALAGRPAQVELVEVSDLEQAAALGMTGSPTILIDGADPFAPDGAAPSVSCRLYRGADGTVSGAPGEAAVRRAVAEANGPDR